MLIFLILSSLPLLPFTQVSPFSPSWLIRSLCYHIVHQSYRPQTSTLQKTDLDATSQPTGTICATFWPFMFAMFFCFTSDVSAFASNFTIILQRINIFIPHFSELGKPESPGFLNLACNPTVCLKCSPFHRWRYSPLFHQRFVQARSECLLATKRPEEHFIPCKTGP